ncbi:MAG: hypothetical protein HPY69_05725 [Armatimonadetes bacterium]|nr:hypothetical protein [Armatimonadota bacterium]
MKVLRCCAPAVVLLAVVSAVVAQAPPAPAPPPPPPLATVNGSPITKDHVAQAIDDRWAAPILRDIIEDRLVRQEARRLGITVSAAEVAAAVAAERTRQGSEAGFQRYLRTLGMTEAAFTQKTSRELLLAKLMGNQIAVSETAAKAYYDAHPEEFGATKQVHLLAIVTTTVEDAYLARERLAAGDQFGTVARELSVHESRDKGGDMGWVSPGDLPDQALADQVFRLEQNDVSYPIRSGNNYWIALVTEVQGKPPLSFAEARPAIVAKLQGTASVSRDDYLRELVRRSDIRVTWAPVTWLTEEYRAYRNIRVFVDGKELALGSPPVRLASGNIIVPAKPVLQSIGARLDWKAAEQSLTASTLAGRVKVVVGAPRALVGQDPVEAVDIKEPPQMRSGQLWIPPRPVLTALGARVEWDARANALRITSPEQELPPPTVVPAQGALELAP